MASVDGSRSYLAGSDEVLQHICGPCKDDGEEKEAKFFCEFCKVHLCLDCRKDHKTFKATKHHSIVSAYLTSVQGSTADKGTFVIFCSCDQKRAVEVYCENHTEVICSTCETIKHRNCKTCPIKDKVTKDTKEKLREVLDEAKTLQAKIESCKQDGETRCKKLNQMKYECKKEIIAFRQEINKLLDKMENEIIQSLDEKANLYLQAIEKQISVLSATLQALAVDMNTIENSNKTNLEQVMFSADVKISKRISEYGEFIQDIRNGMQQPKLEFQKNKKLTDMLKSVDVFGRIETPEQSSIQHDSTVILDMKVKSTKEVNIKLSDDDVDPFIQGCTFLSNGCVLVCDYWNKKLKMLDSGMCVKKSLELSNIPYNVAAVGEKEAIITYDGSEMKDLQYIYTYPDSKLGKKITLPDKCLGVHIVNDEIYTTCHKGSGHDEIWKLDRAGFIMSKIILTQSSSARSEYFCLGSLADPNPRVYLTDFHNSKVVCLQLDGRIVYQYEDTEQLKRPNGIYVDAAGNSLVCGSSSNNVVVITVDGRKHGELLSSKDITNPRCIDYRPEDNTLIVGCETNSKLFVYKLGK